MCEVWWVEIFVLFTYEAKANSLCFIVRAADLYKTDFIAVPSS